MNGEKEGVRIMDYGLKGKFKPYHFPEILMDASGRIVLCRECKSSSVTRQEAVSGEQRAVTAYGSQLTALYVCNSCGTAWRQPC